MTMALLYITLNRALFSAAYFGVLFYGACVSIKKVVYLSSPHLCTSSIFYLPVAALTGTPERYFINAGSEIQFLPQGPSVRNKKICLPEAINISPGGFKKNNCLYDCG